MKYIVIYIKEYYKEDDSNLEKEVSKTAHTKFMVGFFLIILGGFLYVTDIFNPKISVGIGLVLIIWCLFTDINKEVNFFDLDGNLSLFFFLLAACILIFSSIFYSGHIHERLSSESVIAINHFIEKSSNSISATLIGAGSYIYTKKDKKKPN